MKVITEFHGYQGTKMTILIFFPTISAIFEAIFAILFWLPWQL